MESLRTTGRAAEALRMLESAERGLLGELIRLFEAIRNVMRSQHREIGVSISSGGRCAIAIVDHAEAVADLVFVDDADDPIATSPVASNLVTRTARWGAAQQPVFVLDTARLAAGDPGRA